MEIIREEVNTILVNLRLYSWHDPDLLSVKETNSIASLFRASLNAYINNKALDIAINPPAEKIYPRQSVYSIRILLDSVKDREIIDFIHTIRRGYRNSFYRNLMRHYITQRLGFMHSLYFSESLYIENPILSQKNSKKEILPYKNEESSHTDINIGDINDEKISYVNLENSDAHKNNFVTKQLSENHTKIENNEDDEEDDELFLMAAMMTNHTGKNNK